MNFGLFNGPDPRLVFDLNDFDESHPGPFEWDVKRLAASVALAGRNNELSPNKIDRAVRAAVAACRKAIWDCSQQSPLDINYGRIEVDQIGKLVEADSKAKKRFGKLHRKAMAKDSVRALSKLSDVVDGRRVIVSDPPMIKRIDELFEPEHVTTLIRLLSAANGARCRRDSPVRHWPASSGPRPARCVGSPLCPGSSTRSTKTSRRPSPSSIYSHVDRESLCVYSQLKSCSLSEVAAMIEGLLRHETDVEIDGNYVDTHGQSEVGFAFCELSSDSGSCPG